MGVWFFHSFATAACLSLNGISLERVVMVLLITDGNNYWRCWDVLCSSESLGVFQDGVDPFLAGFHSMWLKYSKLFLWFVNLFASNSGFVELIILATVTTWLIYSVAALWSREPKILEKKGETSTRYTKTKSSTAKKRSCITVTWNLTSKDYVHISIHVYRYTPYKKNGVDEYFLCV